jgi:hypothetical protein
MRTPACLAARNLHLLVGISILLALPGTSLADIYRWEDEAGVVHFTDDPSGIPERYRRKAQDILKSPPAAGKPSLSTVGPSAPAGGVPPASVEPSPPGDSIPLDSLSPSAGSTAAEAEQLRAKVAAKEQFIDAVDRKRSNILNPLGNRFVDPADLDLYRKYQEELPGDRSRLKELEAALSPSVN